MNILYCGDENIEDGLLISILSLIKNTKATLSIYIMTIDIAIGTRKINPVSDKTAKFLDELVKEKNNKNFVRKINVTKVFKKKIPKANIDTRFTPCCMLRLYADIVEELPDKVLYLDNDVICNRNCSFLYNMDMKNIEVAGVLDYYGKWFFRKKIYSMDYINSGVLLLNLKEIKRTGLFTKCRKLCQVKKMFMPDQSAINKLSISKRIVPNRFNEQHRLKSDTVFLHFTTSFVFLPWFHTRTIKPWQIKRVHEELRIFEYDDIFCEYEKLLPIMKSVKG